MDDTHYGGHKWYAIIQGTLGKYLPTKEKILGSFKVKEHADIAVGIHPEDATIQTVLGEWCFAVANVSMVERAAASTLFATPPSATYAEARAYFEAAVAIEPYLHTMFMLGEVAKAEGNKAAAADWYQKAIDAPPLSKQDQVDQEASRAGLAAVSAKGWFG